MRRIRNAMERWICAISELQLPASHFGAHGRVGAYPLTSSTSLNVDFHSANLSEFNTLLQDLGVESNGKAGFAALPVGINGQADFRGTWEDSLASPRINGQLQATQVAIELPVTSGAPKVVRWDSIEAEGSYTPERISVVHGQLQHGDERIDLNGTLSATPPAITSHRKAGGQQLPAFDSNSVLSFHARASKVSVAEVLPLAGIETPITGTIDAQIAGEGPISALNGSGSLTLKDGTIYGEPVNSVAVQGSFDKHVLTLKEATAATPVRQSRAAWHLRCSGANLRWPGERRGAGPGQAQAPARQHAEHDRTPGPAVHGVGNHRRSSH